MRICPVITVSPATLPSGLVGSPYSQAITATGGTGTYTYAVTAGALPAGLTLSAGGLLSGTPTAAGAFNFTVTATDSNGCTGSVSYNTGGISAYDVYIYDDYGRAFLCLNSANGDFSYTILRGWAGGSTFTGTALTYLYNGVLSFHTPAGLPYSLIGSYLQRYNKGKAAFTHRPLRISSTDYDSNTLNNPPNCNSIPTP